MGIPQKKMALKVYMKISKKAQKRNIKRHLHLNNPHVNRIHGHHGAHRAAHHIKRSVNVRRHISKTQTHDLSHTVVNKILRKSTSLHAAHTAAKRFAVKVLRDKKATISMKKMAIKVFRRIKKKLQQVGNHSQHHAQRHHVQRHHNVQRVPRHVARGANKKMSLTVKKHISPNRIAKLSKAIGQKILRVAKSHKKAGRIARKFVMKILRNPKATRSMKIMAIKVLRHVRNVQRTSHKKHHNQHPVHRRALVSGPPRPIQRQPHHIQRQHQHIQRQHHQNSHASESKRRVKTIAKNIIRNAKNLNHAKKLAKLHALKTLRNPSASLKQKKEALKVFKKIKAIIITLKKVATEKAIKSIPKTISEYDIKKVSGNVLKQIKNMTQHHKIEELDKFTKNISDKILNRSDSTFTSKKVIATMIKKVVNNKQVSTATKQVLNNIASNIIHKTKNKKEKKH